MARGVQITIVTSMRGRCRFVESLKGITLGIFFENEGLYTPCHFALLLNTNICLSPEDFDSF